MKRYKSILGFLFVLLPAILFAGECTSYSLKGNEVQFNCSDNTKLSLKICSESVIKVWYDPKGVLEQNKPSFAVINDSLGISTKIEVSDQSACYELYTSRLRIRVNKNPMQLQIFDKWQKLVFSDYKDNGHLSDADKKRKKAYKILRKDELFFGLGEKTGSLNRRGREYKMWNSDKPCYSTTEDPLYKSIPFFLSNYQYGIFLDNTYKTEFKFGTESDDYYSFEAPDGEFIYYFIFGKDYKEILSQYITLTGKPIMPPNWAFGFSQSRGLYTSEKQAIEIASEFRKRQIPCDVIYQDIGWTQHLQNFEWRQGNYHNPREMVSKLKDKGFKMILSQDPVISKANNNQWTEADSLGFLVKDFRSGKSYDMPWPWGGNCGVVDFTNPEVANWWGKYQQKPLDDGVKGFWTDMGEPAWSNEEDVDRLNMKHHAGMHDEIHNVFGLTWDKVVKEQFEKRNPDKRIFQMTRAAYAGLQRYTFGWTGDSGNGNDVLEGWGQLANQIQIGISSGLGGIPFWTTDISGYCGDITNYPAMAELYTRWMQFGVFNPLSRAHHEGDNAVEPWKFGETAETNCKAAIELKYQLFPFIYSYAREAHDTGLPINRGLFMEFPNDTEAIQTENQFMFGKELLIAPVVKKGERVKKVYLPEGEWIDFNNKQTKYSGGQSIMFNSPLNIIPMFVKKGSIIPMMPVMQYIHEQKEYPLYVHIFPDNIGETASFDLYEDNGEDLGYLKDVFSRTLFQCTTTISNGYKIVITANDKGFKQADKRDMVLILNGIERKPQVIKSNGKKIKFVKQNKFNSDQEAINWTWIKNTKECRIKIADSRINYSITIN